jgi:hypothetical protein
MMKKEEIIENLKKSRDYLNGIIELMESEAKDSKEERITITNISFNTFNLIDLLYSTESDIYNYLKERQDGVLFRKESKKDA